MRYYLGYVPGLRHPSPLLSFFFSFALYLTFSLSLIFHAMVFLMLSITNFVIPCGFRCRHFCADMSNIKNFDDLQLCIKVSWRWLYQPHSSLLWWRLSHSMDSLPGLSMSVLGHLSSEAICLSFAATREWSTGGNCGIWFRGTLVVMLRKYPPTFWFRFALFFRIYLIERLHHRWHDCAFHYRLDTHQCLLVEVWHNGDSFAIGMHHPLLYVMAPSW